MLTASKTCCFIEGGIRGKEMSRERMAAQFAATGRPANKRHLADAKSSQSCAFYRLLDFFFAIAFSRPGFGTGGAFWCGISVIEEGKPCHGYSSAIQARTTIGPLRCATG
jgi:hypothetical protein